MRQIIEIEHLYVFAVKEAKAEDMCFSVLNEWAGLEDMMCNPDPFTKQYILRIESHHPYERQYM